MFQKAVSKSEIIGEMWGGNVDGAYITVYLLKSGEVFATEGYCTHERCMLVFGSLWEGEIECSCHGARFEVKTGKALSPPADEWLLTYPAELRGDDIYVDLS